MAQRLDGHERRSTALQNLRNHYVVPKNLCLVSTARDSPFNTLKSTDLGYEVVP